jgi:hypothetical protein
LQVLEKLQQKSKKLINQSQNIISQKSKKVHSDWSLKSILYVLKIIQEARKENLSQKEDVLLMNALKNMNLSNLVFDDTSCYIDIIANMFTGVKLDKSTQDIGGTIITNVSTNCCDQFENSVIKVVQLFKTYEIRYSIIIDVILEVYKHALLSH